VFCLFADLLARNLLAPTELSISVVTSILGAPVVIVMLILAQRRKAGDSI
jgi:iron complex transport system permease protein